MAEHEITLRADVPDVTEAEANVPAMAAAVRASALDAEPASEPDDQRRCPTVAMKATLRRNGRRMVTVRAAHHLDGPDIAQMILVFLHGGYHVAEVGDQWSRSGIERFVRDVLRAFGGDATSTDSRPDWRDDYDDRDDREDYFGQAVRWAAGLVRQHFPDLAGEALDVWEREELDQAGLSLSWTPEPTEDGRWIRRAGSPQPASEGGGDDG